MIDIIWNGTAATAAVPGIVLGQPKRDLLGKSRGAFVPVAGRRGSIYYPDYRDRRNITVEGFILTETWHTQRRDAITALADWLDVDIEARLIISDEPEVYYDAVFVDPGDTEEFRELGKFELTWAVMPYSNDLNPQSLMFTGTTSYATAFDPDLLTWVYPIIEITPQDGTLETFTFGLNGSELQWADGVLNSGDTLTINSINTVITRGPSGDAELTGAYDPTMVSLNSVTGTFPYLVPGTNTLVFSIQDGTATEVQITVYYRKQYRK